MGYYKNYVEIKDENEKYDDYFDEIWENDWFIVIDKQFLGQEMGAEIIEDLNNDEITYVDENGLEDFTNEFKDKMLSRVKKEITDELSEEICEYMLEYIGNNIS